LKAFFRWLAGQPGYRARLSYSDADYFNLPSSDVAVAKAARDKAGPTLEQVLHVLRSMPDASDFDKRDRALVAFVILTGARADAVASMRLKHVDLDDGKIVQDAREVRTKFAKTFTTTFFPVGDEPRAIVTEWVHFLQAVRLWGPDDPLFAATKVSREGRAAVSRRSG